MSLTRCLVALIVASLPALTLADNWPEFRGPGGQGHSEESSLPLEWGEGKNIAWQTDVPGEGWSSPVYWNGRVYLTTAISGPDSRRNDRQLAAMCLDAVDGAVLWTKMIFEQKHDETETIHGKNSHASPTPVTDGRHLFVHFGPQGTACLTLDGEVVWRNRGLRYSPQHGSGNSPVLVDDLLFVNCDGRDAQFVVALDSKSGKVRWKTDRPELRGKKGFSFGTPLAITVNGQKQIISPAADWVVAYRPSDGKELWRFAYGGYSVIPRPVFGHGLIFVSSSYDDATLYALRPGPQPEVVWSTDKGAPHTSSPLLVGDELYFVSDRGVGTCVDARTGDVHWVKRLGGNYSASPVFAGGHLYFQNEDGGTVILRPGTTYDEVAQNSLPGRTLATFAVADQAIFLRSDSALYRIQND